MKFTAFELSARHVAGLGSRETQTRKCISSKFFYSKYKNSDRLKKILYNILTNQLLINYYSDFLTIVKVVTHKGNNQAYAEPRSKVQGLVFAFFGFPVKYVIHYIYLNCRNKYVKHMKLGLENKHIKSTISTSKKKKKKKSDADVTAIIYDLISNFPRFDGFQVSWRPHFGRLWYSPQPN